MDKKIIAFICPLSEPDSDVRHRSDDIMDNVIEPIAKDLNYTVQRADKLSGNVVMDDIIEMLHKADIVIADLTDMNPNVFYELGIRQAIKGKCINIICGNKNEKLPFDISYYRAHFYTRNGTYKDVSDFKKYIQSRIEYLKKADWDPKIILSTNDLTDIHKVTVVSKFLKGAKNHYSEARKLFAIPCKRIFLMQRSSSLILNAELGWGEEGDFLKRIKKAIDTCEAFFHIITLEGIEAHLQRKNSAFPNFKNFSDNIEECDGLVTIRRKKNTSKEEKFYLRKLPVDTQDSLFKLDRQSRVLIVEDIENNVKAVVVQNLGADQTCFVIQGPKAKEYLEACVNYYNECELVKWSEVEKLYKKYAAK